MIQVASGKHYLDGEKIPAEVKEFSCLFPARFQYLASKLNIDQKYFICEEFETWKDSFEASGISIIYASQYLENPASSFGHTFFKINSLKKALFLNKVVSFAAEVPKDVSAGAYIWKGLTGGFDGFFNVYPFYLSFQEYANMERRDLWEYELNLSKEQTEQILAHLYELIKRGQFNYSFLYNNCSGLLLRVLESSLNTELVSDLPFYIVPGETIKILKNKNLIKQVIYHPSITTRLKSESLNLNHEESNRIAGFMEGENKLLTSDSVQVLDMGLEYLNFKRQKNAGVFFGDDKNRFDAMLIARASKPSNVNSGTAMKKDIDLFPPELSSGARRVLVGMIKIGKKNKGVFSYRPVGKDFLDPPNGYLKESEINVLRTTLFFAGGKTKNIQFETDVLGVKKYVDFDRLTQNTSWGANFSLKSNQLELCSSCYFGELDSFYGLGKNIFQQNLLTYLVFHPTIQYGNLKSYFAFLPQVETGIIYSDQSFILKVSIFNGLKFPRDQNNYFTNISTSIAKNLQNGYGINFRYNYVGLYSKNSFEVGSSYSF